MISHNCVYPRLFLSFGFIFICLLSQAQQDKKLDSLRALAYKIAHDSISNTENDLAIIRDFLHEAKLTRSDEDIIFSYQQLAAINYNLGHTNQSLRYYKLYVIELEQLSDFLTFKEQRFEKNLYENEIRALNSKIESLEQEIYESGLERNKLLAKNYWIYLGLRVVLVISTLLFLGWLYIKYKKSRSKPVSVEKTTDSVTIRDVLATTKDQLTKVQTELNLADLLVQDIISHPDELFALNKSIRKKFLIFQPKNMAGGDGLYITVEKYKTFIAIFDTPGYGAAGGLLSTRIYGLLEELVKEHRILSPSLVLNQMEINLLNLFPAGVPFAGGVNMAICLYDSTLKTITFSGSNMDLFIVQKGGLQIQQGAAKSLMDGNEPLEYASSEISIGRGTNLYLSTEGYWRQRGGMENRALGRTTFEKTIGSLSSQPIMEHEQVLTKIFNDWKGGNEQDDDVLVMGLGF
jgi:stage II sporulation SpoE-like protein